MLICSICFLTIIPMIVLCSVNNSNECENEYHENNDWDDSDFEDCVNHGVLAVNITFGLLYAAGWVTLVASICLCPHILCGCCWRKCCQKNRPQTENTSNTTSAVSTNQGYQPQYPHFPQYPQYGTWPYPQYPPHVIPPSNIVYVLPSTQQQQYLSVPQSLPPPVYVSSPQQQPPHLQYLPRPPLTFPTSVTQNRPQSTNVNAVHKQEQVQAQAPAPAPPTQVHVHVHAPDNYYPPPVAASIAAPMGVPTFNTGAGASASLPQNPSYHAGTGVQLDQYGRAYGMEQGGCVTEQMADDFRVYC